MGSRGGSGAGEGRRRRHVDAAAVASPSISLERSCNLPMVPAMYGPQGWADLPDALLHSILSLLVSFPDLLAFASTCPSWRAAFASYPSKSSFSTLFPPLLLQSDVPLCSPRPRPYSSNLPRRPCYVTNLASQNMYMCCQIPLFCQLGKRKGLRSPLDEFRFIGASYGHLILSNKKMCRVVDVFTGVSVLPPQIPFDEDTQVSYGALTDPLSSPNSHLMVTTPSHNFFWRVDSDSWILRSTHDRLINRVVIFKGQVFGMDSHYKLYIVHLVPNIRIQEIAVDLTESMVIAGFHSPLMWLVTCGDMLLMVSRPGNTFEAFRLDLSTKPAKWVKVEKLENCAIFISTDDRSQALCCMDPERWGGRSNCIYFYGSKEWMTCQLGKPLRRIPIFRSVRRGKLMQPTWVVPSMFCSCP